MSAVESSASQLLTAVGVFAAGGLFTAGLKFVFDRISTQMGWSREDKRAQDGKIERVDSHARAEVARIERELGGRLNEAERKVDVLCEKVESLPTADDFQALDRRIGDLGANLGRDISGVVSKVDGMNVTVKTILDHILAGERRA